MDKRSTSFRTATTTSSYTTSSRSSSTHDQLGGYSLSSDEIEARRKLLLQLGIACCPAWFLAIGSGWGAYYYGGVVALSVVFVSCLQIEHTRTKSALLKSNCCLGARSTFSTLRTFHVINAILSFAGIIVDLTFIALLTNGKYESFAKQEDKGLRVTLCAVNMLSMLSICILSFVSARKVMMVHEWVNFRLSRIISRGSDTFSVNEIAQLRKEKMMMKEKNSSSSSRKDAGTTVADAKRDALTPANAKKSEEVVPYSQSGGGGAESDCDSTPSVEIVTAESIIPVVTANSPSAIAPPRPDDYCDDGTETIEDKNRTHNSRAGAYTSFDYTYEAIQPTE